MVPILDKRYELGEIFFPDMAVQHKAAIGCVVKRSDHAGNIPQRRTFKPALAVTSRGFTFKICNDKIFSCEENLTKVIISVNADLDDIYFFYIDPSEHFKNILFHSQDFFRLFAKLGIDHLKILALVEESTPDKRLQPRIQ